jgi:hypothetical protein
LLAALVIVAVAASFAARVAMRGSSFASFGAAEPESLPERGGLVLVVGVVVAAIGEAAIAPGALSRVPPTLAVAIAVAVAVPLGVPLLAAIPIAAVASHKGLAPSAVLAFLVAAPSSDRGVHQAILEACGARAAVVSRVVVIVGALLVGLVPVASDGPAMHPLVAHVHHPIELACAAIVGALLIVSIVRRGARGWLGGDDEHAHALT